jgi:outer membrane protein OmpA-like peptidoglycan-associated protein
MRGKLRALVLAGAVVGTACATTRKPPEELVDARLRWDEAARTPVAQAEPEAWREAQAALEVANRAHAAEEPEWEVKDKAYVAMRKIQRAEVLGRTAQLQQQRVEAERRYQQQVAAREEQLRQELEAARQRTDVSSEELQAREQALQQAQQELEAQQQELARAQQEAEEARQQLEEERLAREQAEKQMEEALSRVAQVREESRGLVVTLTGSLPFRSGSAVLLPRAQETLTQVAQALRQSEQPIVVEGHTDAQGPEAANEQLSERRAQVVRDFLVDQGIPAERIRSRGYGELRPVASNTSPEGRALNRRVEIVLARPPAEAVGGSGEQERPEQPPSEQEPQQR